MCQRNTRSRSSMRSSVLCSLVGLLLLAKTISQWRSTRLTIGCLLDVGNLPNCSSLTPTQVNKSVAQKLLVVPTTLSMTRLEHVSTCSQARAFWRSSSRKTQTTTTGSLATQLRRARKLVFLYWTGESCLLRFPRRASRLLKFAYIRRIELRQDRPATIAGTGFLAN